MAAAVIGGLVTGIFVTGAGAAGAGGDRVVVTDADGETLVSTELPASRQYAIDYQHSYYDQPATEVFAADGAGFHVVSISSPSEAVLDYYELTGTRSTTAAGLHVLVPDAPAQLTELPLIATGKGRRTLVVDGERYPLYPAVGASHVLIRVTADSRLSQLLSWRS